jgi:cytochrome P450
VGLPSSIPRLIAPAQLVQDPLFILRAAGSCGSEVVAIMEGNPVFSRAQDCVGVVAVFGRRAIRQVLTQPETFGMPVSIGKRFSLPERLVKLNSGLFSMAGERHHSRQQLLMQLLNSQAVNDYAKLIAEACRDFVAELRTGCVVPLLIEMRRLVCYICDPLFFGLRPSRGCELGQLVQDYFDRRREYAAERGAASEEARRDLIALGEELDSVMRTRLAELRGSDSGVGEGPACLFARMSRLRDDAGEALSEDELIAHANVLFMSSSEPVATALTWTLLLLSQSPALRHALKAEAAKAHPPDGSSLVSVSLGCHLLDWIIAESLRLLPPNAIMVRLTTAVAKLGGHELPQNCEVVLSPYVEHRNRRVYPMPEIFDPYRWSVLKPSPFEYLPFGVGARYCLGKPFAMYILKVALATILDRFDVVLAGDQEIDWRMHVTLRPRDGPMMCLLPPARDGGATVGGRLAGPIAKLVRFSAATADYA